jgi:phospholipid/cholesterol/gamma-HCH transport system ATP-binding protein
MKKRVSLARALAFGPSTIFYDEPDSGLDPVMTRKIDDLIIETQKKLGVTSIVVTHDMESACLVADRIAMLYQGEIIALEKTEDFRRVKDPRVREFLGSFAID